jgi:hypothetical protein
MPKWQVALLARTAPIPVSCELRKDLSPAPFANHFHSDLKCMAKICAGVELLRQGNAEGWNSTFDASLQGWVTQYISWITTDSIAVEEKKSTK